MEETLSHTHGTPTPSITVPRAPIPRGFRHWLPVLAVLIGMPLLALAATKYVVLPSVKDAFSPSKLSSEYAAPQESANLVIAKLPLPLPVVAHSDFKSLTLVGDDSALKDQVNQNKDKLTSIAVNTLNGVVLSDFDRPGALDRVRTQLVVSLNRALGASAIKEVYITAKFTQ